MLSKEDNELLTHVGPGTPMGNLLRQYWIPSAMSVELPAPDCPPLRLRLLGENLIAFRTTSGKVGVMQNACPHRGASLFFGRNEEDGLRCVYHGWKFDVAGNCVDMPSEPSESNFRTKVHAVSYPTQERGGMIWTYMGSRTDLPPLPSLEGNMGSEGQAFVGAYFADCNWMQSLEGDFDTIHVSFLHRGGVNYDDIPNSLDRYAMRTRWARHIVEDTEIGCSNGNYRPSGEDSTYWRIAQYLFPFYAMPPGSFDVASVIAVVPMDDEHTIRWHMGRTEFSSKSLDAVVEGVTTGYATDARNNTTEWLGRFRPAGNLANDYLIDRATQQENRGPRGFTGIPGRGQDGAVTETMGTIYKRDQEHLGITDSGIIRMRRLLINAAEELRDNGSLPPGVESPESYLIRSGAILLPEGVNGIQATQKQQWQARSVEAPKLQATP